MFCVICFEDCDFLFRRCDKKINSKCADAEMEKERVQRDKNGNMNDVEFYAVSSSSYLVKVQETYIRGELNFQSDAQIYKKTVIIREKN